MRADSNTMSSIKVWLLAARLRTLPLSVAGIFMGAGLALRDGQFSFVIFILALLTTVAFQVLSNFANDYGDGVKGTDNASRVGPTRALGSGLLSRKRLKNGIITTVIIGAVLSLSLIYVAFGSEKIGTILVFIFLGAAAIAAAIKYTVGDNAYGYRGMGDVFVFLFFGLLGVLGSTYLFTEHLEPLDLLPALTLGFFSTAVLNLNNMRDLVEDKKVGKKTLAVILGPEKVRHYHYALLIMGMVLWTAFIVLTAQSIIDYFALVPLLSILRHMYVVQTTAQLPSLDGELKVVALSTFLLAFVYYITQMV